MLLWRNYINFALKYINKTKSTCYHFVKVTGKVTVARKENADLLILPPPAV